MASIGYEDGTTTVRTGFFSVSATRAESEVATDGESIRACAHVNALGMCASGGT